MASFFVLELHAHVRVKIIMIGAIIGDICGSLFNKSSCEMKDFDLLNSRAFLGADGVMTFAVWNICLNATYSDKKAMIDTMRMWGDKHPDIDYGAKFYSWLLVRRDYESNDSYGNGAAARVCAIPYFCESIEEVKERCSIITALSHNHVEAIKSAEVVGVTIFKALHKASKSELSEYMGNNYPILKDEMSLRQFIEANPRSTCQVSLSVACSSFLLTDSFEECLRLVLSLGQDASTNACIACSIAEAFYGIDSISKELKDFAVSKTFEHGEAEGVSLLLREMNRL